MLRDTRPLLQSSEDYFFHLLLLFSPSFFLEVTLIYVLHVFKPSLNLPVARVYKHELANIKADSTGGYDVGPTCWPENHSPHCRALLPQSGALGHSRRDTQSHTLFQKDDRDQGSRMPHGQEGYGVWVAGLLWAANEWRHIGERRQRGRGVVGLQRALACKIIRVEFSSGQLLLHQVSNSQCHLAQTHGTRPHITRATCR